MEDIKGWQRILNPNTTCCSCQQGKLYSIKQNALQSWSISRLSPPPPKRVTTTRFTVFQVPEGEDQPTTDVDLFISTERLKVVNTSTKVSAVSRSVTLNHTQRENNSSNGNTQNCCILSTVINFRHERFIIRVKLTFTQVVKMLLCYYYQQPFSRLHSLWRSYSFSFWTRLRGLKGTHRNLPTFSIV